MSSKPLWHWRGLTPQGEYISGTLWSPHRVAVVNTLEERHISALRIRRCRVHSSHWHPQRSGEMVGQLATLLQAGLTLSDGLELLAAQHPSAQWQALLYQLARELQQGIAFSVALEAWPEAFPPLFIAMIRTGELTGELELCCQHLARQQESQHRLNLKVKKALRYPLIVLSVTLIVVVAMLGFVLPEFTAIYQTFNTPLPALTRGVIAAAALFHDSLIPLLAVLLSGALVAKRFHRHPGWQLYRQALLLRLPLAGPLVLGQTLSQIFTVLSLTQNAGIAFLQGLGSVEVTLQNRWWQKVIHQVHEEVSQGSAIWQALAKHPVFPSLSLQLIRTGEASGALDRMLNNLAQHYQVQTEQLADELATLLEPLMLLVTGIIIGTLVVAMYLPVFHLGDAIGGMGG
ncbi:protein transport protein HofC [Yokenella regensburgei]|uniref:Cholera toxin secretion protein epsF n=1 Tax=Yokenella regensburgei TaxID=158877 RepID=A0AB38FWS2_9ENTR|nr:protein transport protein HofC [Yokenella regensburgei]KFD25371.1 PilC family type IV fimbrial assembly protein [Yokenella regensburgei ATCC 49455]SQA63090.1 Cholera toxin secretion protein epsF [Yokenella regensburgei]SQA68510.1 Cholera toxin secretion protein epsF [Yokenella regensburgei]SUQ06825.1 Cholera toxin secretion protein epsF [Yokenella regensburgei]